MSTLAVATMIVVCGTVWGGFLLLLARALRRENAKRHGRPAPDESAQDPSVAP